MQSDLGKLFIGGISWNTDEERLKKYFNGYGEVLEAVIMKDRNTGRARGFGFIVFADSSVAERVIMEKHTIDGRMVEAKKAVPRDDHNTMSSSIQGSPVLFRTRKMFVGGLASSVTEVDFKKYFEQYGTIIDAVVMYDHNTQRPRGFGFITYDSEEAVEKVLMQSFHELNGKMVEVKRAVPKELSPSPSRSPISGGGYNYGLSMINKFLNGYNQQGYYSPNATGGYGVRMDDRFSPIASSRNGFAPFGSSYGMGLNLPRLSLNPNFEGNATFNNNIPGNGREMKPFYVGNSNRLVANPIGYDGGNSGNSSFFSSSSRNLWGNGLGSNYIGNFSSSGINWTTSSPVANQGGENLNFGVNVGGFGLGGGGGEYGRSSSAAGPLSLSSYDATSSAGYDGAFSDLYSSTGRTGYDDPAWRSTIIDREGSGSLDYILGNEGSDIVTTNSPPGYVVGSYNNVLKRLTNKGIPG